VSGASAGSPEGTLASGASGGAPPAAVGSGDPAVASARPRLGAARGDGPGPSAARRLAAAPIRAYQLLVSPLFAPRCRYYPSCSEYAVQAIERFGILRGLVLAGWRILRCNPWSPGGVDLVEDQRLFKRGPHVSST